MSLNMYWLARQNKNEVHSYTMHLLTGCRITNFVFNIFEYSVATIPKTYHKYINITNFCKMYIEVLKMSCTLTQVPIVVYYHTKYEKDDKDYNSVQIVWTSLRKKRNSQTQCKRKQSSHRSDWKNSWSVCLWL